MTAASLGVKNELIKTFVRAEDVLWWSDLHIESIEVSPNITLNSFVNILRERKLYSYESSSRKIILQSINGLNITDDNALQKVISGSAQFKLVFENS